MNSANKNPGAYSFCEILSQPSCWKDCLEQLPQIISRQRIGEVFRSAREWLFVGCGSSYYIALAAAASWNVITGCRARAVPASEVLLFPELALAGSRSSELAAVVISRSGRTSEAVRAAEVLRARSVPILGITCTPDQPLTQVGTSTITLLPANEESTVMTRSFTAMLLASQYTAAFLAGNGKLSASLHDLAANAEPVLSAIPSRIKDFVASQTFSDYVCLGQGALYGLACESALKLSEMSISYAQSYHTLEFRHGPKSVVSPETAVLFLISENGYEAESEVLQETKTQGGTTIAIVNRADDRIRASSDLLIEFGFQVPEFARIAPHAFVGQLMGLYTGLKKGVDPDNPRNLSRVVMLGKQATKERSDHATF